MQRAPARAGLPSGARGERHLRPGRSGGGEQRGMLSRMPEQRAAGGGARGACLGPCCWPGDAAALRVVHTSPEDEPGIAGSQAAEGAGGVALPTLSPLTGRPREAGCRPGGIALESNQCSFWRESQLPRVGHIHRAPGPPGAVPLPRQATRGQRGAGSCRRRRARAPRPRRAASIGRAARPGAAPRAAAARCWAPAVAAGDLYATWMRARAHA